MHPAPFVTHPLLYDEQAVFVSNDIDAPLHALEAQLEVVFTIQPVSHESEHEASVNC